MLILKVIICIYFVQTTYCQVRSCYYTLNDPPVSLIEDSLCTHIILIGQAKVDVLGLLETPSSIATDTFKNVKKYAPNTKLLICVTGSNPSFSKLVSNTILIDRFVNKSKWYLETYGFDGLDLDWEFPAWSSDAQKSDKYLFGNLLEKLYERLNGQYLITAAVSGPPTISKIAYDISKLNRYLDFVQVMNYDFHIFSYLYPVVGFNAPLRKLRGEAGVIGEMNSESSMATWKKLGLWSNKTVFGIPTYSRAYLLVNKYMHKPYALAEGTVEGYSKKAVICEILKDEGNYRYIWNKKASSPYVYGNDKIWISTEDERSMREKAQYANQLNIAGIMIYDLGSDDYYGSCGNGSFPLIKAINSVINNKK